MSYRPSLLWSFGRCFRSLSCVGGGRGKPLWGAPACRSTGLAPYALRFPRRFGASAYARRRQKRRPNPSGICMRLKPRRPPLCRTSGGGVCLPVCLCVCLRACVPPLGFRVRLRCGRLRSFGAPPVPVALALACLRIRRPLPQPPALPRCLRSSLPSVCVLRPLCLPLSKALRALNCAARLFLCVFLVASFRAPARGFAVTPERLPRLSSVVLLTVE